MVIRVSVCLLLLVVLLSTRDPKFVGWLQVRKRLDLGLCGVHSMHRRVAVQARCRSFMVVAVFVVVVESLLCLFVSRCLPLIAVVVTVGPALDQSFGFAPQQSVLHLPLFVTNLPCSRWGPSPR